MQESKAAVPPEAQAGAPASLLKRIGSTTYVVNVHFSAACKETLGDKVARLLEKEVLP